MQLSFHGADREVTGSCHLLACAGKRILVDCGLRQGSRELEAENAAPFGFDPQSVDIVLLTHAHLDHCGRLPLLVKRGFRGEIVTTSATRELAQLVMLDAAHLQGEEAEHRSRRNAHHGHAIDEVALAPLYDIADVGAAMQRFGRTADYGRPIDLGSGVRATFFDAGHILGSASVLVDAMENGRRRSVCFSGDIGNAGRPLLRAPQTPPSADAVVMETTYGSRLHKPMRPSIEELYDAVFAAVKRGGNVLIPTFALERAQEILYFLREGMERGRLPAMRVFLDSPMAISATEIYRRHLECFEPEAAAALRDGQDPFAVPGLHVTPDVASSEAIAAVKGAVILAGSGMATGGRIRHHLQRNLARPESTVVFVGYAAAGTLARQIIDGARVVHLFGEEVPVRAQVYTINGFSAHADQAELLRWHAAIRPPTTILVHGEMNVMQTFGGLLQNTRVEMPGPGDSLEV